MDQREAYERRVWRLAFLLSGGDERGAGRIVTEVVDSRGKLSSVEPSRLDRLVVLAARRLRDRGGLRRTDANVADPGIVALRQILALPYQAFEAWILSRVDELDDVGMGRAMDSSRTAATTHLATADRLIADILAGHPAIKGDPRRAAQLIQATVDRSDGLAVVEQCRREANKKRRIKKAVVMLVVAVVAVVAIKIIAGYLG